MEYQKTAKATGGLISNKIEKDFFPKIHNEVMQRQL